MLTNGNWTYTWNGENRLIRAQNIAMPPFFQGRHYVDAVKKCRFHFLRVLYAVLEKRGGIAMFQFQIREDIR